MSFILFILFFIIFILIFGLSIISSILRFIFGIGRKTTNQRANTHQNSSYNTYGTNTSDTENQPVNRKKIFSDDEGEYVEFEEVKEEN